MKGQLATLIRKEMTLYYGMRNPKKEPKKFRHLVWLLFVAAFAPSIWLLYQMMKELYGLLVDINQLPYFFTLALVAVQMLLFMNAIPALMGRFYENKDNDILLAMPIRPGDILISRFIPVLLMQVLLALLLILPTYLVHLQASGFRVQDLLAVLTGWIASVAFPTALAAVIVLLLMRYTNVGKHRDKWKTIGIFLIIGLSVGVQFAIQSSATKGLSPFIILRILTDNKALIDMFGTIFPAAKWTGLAFAYTGGRAFLYIAANLLLILVSGAIVVWIGSKVYLHSIITGQEMSKEKKKVTGELRTQSMKPAVSIFRNEIRTITRTPTYAVNVLSAPLMVSIIWALPLFVDERIRVQLGGLLKNIPWASFPDSAPLWVALLAGIVLGVFFSSFSETATSLSREGEGLWIHRVLPIRSQDEIIGRSLVNVSLLVVTTFAVLLLVRLLIPYPLWALPVALLTATFFTLPMTLAGLAIDATRPKLHWSDPNEAVKQNLNTLFAMLATMCYVALLAFIGYMLFKNIEDPMAAVRIGVIVAFVINGVASFVLYRVTKKALEHTFRTLEG